MLPLREIAMSSSEYFLSCDLPAQYFRLPRIEDSRQGDATSHNIMADAEARFSAALRLQKLKIVEPSTSFGGKVGKASQNRKEGRRHDTQEH